MPDGLAVVITYNGSTTVPTNAGVYTVIGSIYDTNYQGSVTNTLVIAQATAGITLANLNQTYDGTAKPATVITTPAGLAASITYNGSTTAPVVAGSYVVIGTITDANYSGSATNTLVIGQAAANVVLAGLSQTYDGIAKVATATTVPSGLTVNVTYNGLATAPTNAGSYTVIGTISDANYQGGATNTLVISKGAATITVTNLSQTYDGTAKPAAAETMPGGLAAVFTYDGSSDVPTNAGSYTVIGTISDANYQGSATNTLVISQATGGITLSGLGQTFDGTPKPVTVTTVPDGLAVVITYNGSTTVPTNAGTYAVISSINDTNYQGSVTNTLVIAQAVAGITLTDLSQTFDGTAKTATVIATPAGLAASITYNGFTTAPVAAGSYTVIGTITDANYSGSATNTLVIGQAAASVALAGLSQTYDGTAKVVTATTVPSGLTVNFTYNGLAIAPTNAGSYTVIGTISDANYTGSATNMLVIGKGAATIMVTNLSQTYDGAAKPAVAETMPGGLAAVFTYDGSSDVPTNAGSYTVIGTISDANYQGSVTNTLVISQAIGGITLSGLGQTFDGTPKPVTVTTVPDGLEVVITYNGSTTVPTNAGVYTVIGSIYDTNYQGSVTNTLVIAQAAAGISLADLSQTFDGTAKTATVITTPAGLAASITYNGSTTAPVAAGSYTVIGTINDANYQGSATNTLVIGKGTATVTLAGLSQTYDGTAKVATATTVPSGLTVNFAYNGLATAPTNAGSYTVIGTISDANYQGSATNTLVVAQISGSITLAGLSQTYDGTAKTVTVTTVPSGLAVNVTYNGTGTAPTNAGSYTVIATISDANSQPVSITNVLVINTQTLTVTNLLGAGKVYDGTTNATLNSAGAGVSGVLGSDSVTLVTTNAQAYFADKNVGINKPVTVTGLALAGSAAGNYSLLVPANLTANITAATLTITANNTNKLVGQENPSFTASYSGFVGGDTTNVLASQVSLTTTATAVSVAGNYPITPSGASAANYSIQYVNGNLRVILNTTLSLAQITINGQGQCVVSWSAISGQTYQLQYEDSLSTNTWAPVGALNPGLDGIMTITNNLSNSNTRFYRVRVE